MSQHRLLVATVLLVLVLNTFTTVYLLDHTERTIQSVTARATTDQGEVSLCINQAPTLSVPCNESMRQDNQYYCALVASDPEGNNLTYNVTPVAPDNESIFTISASGVINFTPTNDDIGNHTVLISVSDGTSCDNHVVESFFSFTVENVNDPPYLVENIPDQELPANTTLYAFFLNDYFVDPDGDDLEYTILNGTAEVPVTLTLNDESGVIITSGQCGTAYFRFRAKDTYNQTVESNVVTVEVTCDTGTGDTGATGDSDSGGGGGGGASTCKSEMYCLPWTDCFPNGQRRQTCQDKNGCTPDSVDFYEACTYTEEENVTPCLENWLCSEWSVCSIDEGQTRTCDDLAGCGTRKYRPHLEQECVYQPNCTDGVRNGNETGVDCGGPCPACKELQTPSVLTAVSERDMLSWLFIILLLSTLLALFTLYRERVYEFMAELGWALARAHPKEVLLTESEKRTLWEGLATVAVEAPREKPMHAYERLASLYRQYYAFVFDLEGIEYLPEEWKQAVAERTLSDELRHVIVGVESRLRLLESGRLSRDRLNKVFFTTALEELRLLVCMTATYELSELNRAIPEREITPALSFATELRIRLVRAYEALQFERVDVAREEYAALIRLYEQMVLGERERYYPEIHRLYEEITYVSRSLADATTG